MKNQTTLNAKAIKKYRIAKGWSVADLAKRLKTTRQMIYFYENGTYVPPPKKLGKIAKLLGVKPLELLQDTGE